MVLWSSPSIWAAVQLWCGKSSKQWHEVLRVYLSLSFVVPPSSSEYSLSLGQWHTIKLSRTARLAVLKVREKA